MIINIDTIHFYVKDCLYVSIYKTIYWHMSLSGTTSMKTTDSPFPSIHQLPKAA